MIDIEEIEAATHLANITWMAKRRMRQRKRRYLRKQLVRRALVALFILLTFIVALIFVMTKRKQTPVATAEVTECQNVTLQPVATAEVTECQSLQLVEPQITTYTTHEPSEPKITPLELVEPGYIPDADNYYIPWADRLKISLDEFKLLCQTVQCEVGNQDLKCKKYAARVILNRLYSDKFPDTMHDVVYQRNEYGSPQFSVIDWAGFPNCREIDDETETACFLAIAEDDIPSDLFYFNSIGYFTWAIDYWDNGVMYFSRG